MKKAVAVLLVCVLMMSSIFATTAGALDFEYSDFTQCINIIVSSLRAQTNPATRARQFLFYLNSIGKRNSEIDSFVSMLDNDSVLTDTMLSDLTGGGMSREQVKFVLLTIKSLPEADRAVAVEEFTNNQKNGASYDLTAEERAFYKSIYDEFIADDFQTTVLNDYGLECEDFIPFIKVLTKHITLTKDSRGNMAILNISDEFAANLGENLGSMSLNGETCEKPINIMDRLVAALNDGASDTMKDNYIGAFDSNEAYTVIGDFSQDGTVDTDDLEAIVRFLAEWNMTTSDLGISAGAAITDTDGENGYNKLSVADGVKLARYLAGESGVILGRE